MADPLFCDESIVVDVFFIMGQATTWHVALTKDIQIQNINALRHSCRIPEVVEWYYQYQSELNRKFGFLTNVIEVNLYYSVGTGRQNNDSVSSFNISVSKLSHLDSND